MLVMLADVVGMCSPFRQSARARLYHYSTLLAPALPSETLLMMLVLLQTYRKLSHHLCVNKRMHRRLLHKESDRHSMMLVVRKGCMTGSDKSVEDLAVCLS